MKRQILYKDKFGNRLIRDVDKKLAVLNREGLMINPQGTSAFLRQKEVQAILKKKKLIPYFKSTKSKVLGKRR